MNTPLTYSVVNGQSYCSTTDISDHLGVTLSRTLIESRLGIPRDTFKKAGSYWLPEKVPLIRDALVKYLNSLPCS